VIITHSPAFHERQSRGFARPSSRPDASSPNCKPGWPAATPAASAPRPGKRSPASWPPARYPGSCMSPSPAPALPACGCPGTPTAKPARC
jgi:hypothetical protein